MTKKIIVQSFQDHQSLEGDCFLVAHPDMIFNYGLDYYLEGWKGLCVANPGLYIGLAIPCSDDVGLAMRAINASVTAIYFEDNSPIYDKIENLADKAAVALYPQSQVND